MKAIILAAGSGERFRATGSVLAKPLTQLGGLTLLERAVRSAAKAGVMEFLLVTGSEAETVQSTLENRLSDLNVRWIINEQWRAGNGTSVLAAAPFIGSEPFLILMCDHLVFPSTLRRVLAASDPQACTMAIDYKRGLLLDPDDATKVQVNENRIVAVGKGLAKFDGYDTGISLCTADLMTQLSEAARAQDGRCAHTDGMRRLAEAGRLRACDIGADEWEDVDSPASHAAAERLLMRSLRKNTDGFMSRHLERHLSGWVTRRLARTAVTPNQVTCAIVLLGGLAAWLFMQTRYPLNVLGAVVFWCASFLDGCDGELARLKFLESRLGGWLDLWADNVVHMMVFTGIGIGLWRRSGNLQWVILGLTASAGVLISVGWVSLTTLRRKRGTGAFFTSVVPEEASPPDSPWVTRLTELANALSRRDFIFGVIFLTLFDALPAFMWAAAVGANSYWMVLMLLTLKTR